jgi:hypothetical protein
MLDDRVISALAMGLSSHGGAGNMNGIIMDSGASVTITNQRAMLGALRKCNEYAVVANGQRAKFDGVGCAFGLPKVYYLASGNQTLISMSDLVKENTFSASDDSRSITFRSRNDGSVTWRFELKDGLWVNAPQDAFVHSVFTETPAVGAKAMLLHRRLGHCSWRQLKMIVAHSLVDGVEGIKLSELPKEAPYCRACAHGKIKRSPFLAVNPHRSTVPGAGWHVDIIVLRIPAIEGGRYFLLFTDDCTRMWVGYTLLKKSDAIEKFKQFYCKVISFYKLPMVFLKSDRGGEFVSHRFSRLLTAYGVRQFLVTARDPQANGAAERQGQTLFGDVRCMLLDSGMALSFWSYAAQMAIFCRNRLSRGKGKVKPYDITPYEWLTGRKPSIKRVHVFGAHCTYFSDPGNKLLPRGRSARFLGVYDETYYILWDAEAHSVVTKRHVQFRERGPSLPLAQISEGGGDAEPTDSDFSVGVPESAARDLVLTFHDDVDVIEEDPASVSDIGSDLGEEDELLESLHDAGEGVDEDELIDQQPSRPVREFDARDAHLEQIPSTDDFLLREVSRQVQLDEADDIVDDPELLGSDDDEDAHVPGDVIVSAPSDVGLKHPNILRKLSTGLNHDATKTLEEKRSAPRTVVNLGEEEAKDPTPPPPSVPTERRGRGRPRKVPTVDYVMIDNVPIHVSEPVTNAQRDLASLLDRHAADSHIALSAQVVDGETEEIHTVPLNYNHAHKRADSARWTEAEEKEMKGLTNQGVFAWARRSDVPPYAKILTTRYVYDFKTNENMEILKYKARLVVRGFEQRPGMEFGETFSATVRATSIRLVLALAAHERMTLHQFDVEQAFLTASVGDEKIFCYPPPGQGRPGHIWILRKALYGLKQASCLFQKHFSKILQTKLGMVRLMEDASIYMLRRKADKNGKSEILIACVYVDDIMVAYRGANILEFFSKTLSGEIGIKDMGPLKYCLGMLVEQDQQTYSVSVTQTGFIQDLLDRTGLGGDDARTRKTPAPVGERLLQSDSPTTEVDKQEMTEHPYNTYRSIVGSLMYLTGATRPDIGFAVNQLARYVANPGKRHWLFLVHLLRYLAGTKGLGVHYCGNSVQGVILEDEKKRGFWTADCKPQSQLISESFRNNVIAFADADFATDVDTRRSVSGWVTFMNGGPLSWRVKRQSAVATSTAESELYSLGDCAKEVRWLQKLMAELGHPQPVRVPGRGGATAEPTAKKNRGSVIFEDNMSCILISQNAVFHQRTKHIDTMWQFVLQYVEEGYLCITHVPTGDQVADVLTKSVGGTILARLRPRLLGTWYRLSSSTSPC